VSDTTETKITDVDSALSSILEPVEETTEEVLETQETEETTEEVEATAEDETEEVAEEEEVEASDSEDDENPIEEPSQEEPDLYTVKANGQEFQVTLDDLKQDWSGQKYIQQGMQDVANKRKEAEDVYASLNNERQQLAELYQSIQQGGIASMPEKPSKELFDADPIGYMKQNVEYEEKKAEYDNQMAQLQQASQQNSAAQENAKRAYLQEQMQILQREIPEFANESKATKLKDQLVKTGKSTYGYSTEEISQITDHRAIRVLHDAMMYQSILAGTSKAKVKTKSAKPMVKPGAKKVATSSAKIRSRQKAKLRETGSIEDAVGLITNV